MSVAAEKNHLASRKKRERTVDILCLILLILLGLQQLCRYPEIL